MANLVGTTLGKYKVTQLLGSGGMADVYKGYHPSLERYVTIKVMHSVMAEGQDFVVRFKREARAVASLRHPHIQQIHDFDIEGDQYYMVMEFIDWGSLQDLMHERAQAGGYLPIERAMSILRQVAEALDYAHQQNIIHRDIKPSNILLDSAGNAFLADFGIARIMSSTQLTAAGSLIGTPTYMSPEQGRGEELTPVSDIYSLGVILYELMTGKVPFTSETTPLAIILKHINDPPPKPRAVRPDLPEAAEQVVLKALAKAPKDRYQSAGELVQALEKALPEDVIARLDAQTGRERASIPGQPTELMESPPANWASLPTSPNPAEANLPIPTSLPTAPLQAPTKEILPPPAPSLAGQENARETRGGIKSRQVWIVFGLMVCLFVLGITLFRVIPSAFHRYPTVALIPSPLLPTEALETPLPSSTAFIPTSSISTPTLPPPTPGASVIDNFDNPAYDGRFNPNLWKEWGDDLGTTFIQNNGMLEVSLPTTNLSGQSSLSAIQYDNLPIHAPMFLEARMKLVSEVGHVDLIIGGSEFRAVCYFMLTGVDCFTGANTLTTLVNKAISPAHDWHLLRMEIDPDTMGFSIYLDEQLIYTGVPPGAMNYQKADFTFRIGVDNGGQTAKTSVGDFEAVKIDLIHK